MNIKCFPMSCNCYVVSDDDGNCVVFDPCDRAEAIYEYIKNEKMELCAIIITHAHFDHISALNELVMCANQDEKDIPVYINAHDAAAMYNSEKNLSKPLFGSPYVYTGILKTVLDGFSVNVGKMSFLAISAPGHTEGSTCYVCHGARTVFSGDVLFEGSIGRTDFPGGDMTKMRNSLKRIMSIMGNYTVYPGHGPSTTLNEERNNNPYIAGL